MPAVSRDRIDLARTGHGCTAIIGVKATQGSVFANRTAIVRPGDPTLPHTILVCCPPKCVGHRARVNKGSGSVFAVGKSVASNGDSTDFGALFQGSFNVFAGG